jgi:hypothetical protein
LLPPHDVMPLLTPGGHNQKEAPKETPGLSRYAGLARWLRTTADHPGRGKT